MLAFTASALNLVTYSALLLSFTLSASTSTRSPWDFFDLSAMSIVVAKNLHTRGTLAVVKGATYIPTELLVGSSKRTQPSATSKI